MKYKYKNKTFIAIIIAISFGILAIFGALSGIAATFRAPIITLDDNWDITLNGTLLDSHKPEDTKIGVINEGDVVVMSTVLPEIDYYDPCLSTYTIHAIIEVYIDGELIYEFGRDAYEQGRTVPKIHTAIPLKNSYSGKTITISLTGGKVSAFSGLSTVYVGERCDLFIGGVTVRRVNLAIGIFLITLGFVLMILSPYLLFYHNNDLRLFFSGMISLLLGVYIMAYYGLIDMFIGKPEVNTASEYFSLYNIPTSILGYLMSVFTGKKKKVFFGMFVFNVIMLFAIIAVHVNGIIPFTDFTMALHAIAGVESGISIFIIMKDYTLKRKTPEKRLLMSDMIFLLGLLIFIIASLIDMIIYNYNKYYSVSGEANSDIIITTAGALIFVSCLMISYLYYNIYSINIDTLQSHIVNIAYTDALTGLANRARCEQVMAMLSEERSTYTIVSLDLNKLKHVNDTLGHHEGDRLIMGFATILSECFWDANLIGRMGGDEFIVVMTDEHALNCTKRIHELYNIITEWNNKEHAFQYSTSYGYAYSYEVPNGLANEVYMLADSRMYEMKKEHRNDNREGIENA